MRIFKKSKSNLNLFNELCNPFSWIRNLFLRLNNSYSRITISSLDLHNSIPFITIRPIYLHKPSLLCNSFSRFTILEKELCKLRERITNPRVQNPQCLITIYSCRAFLISLVILSRISSVK